MDFFYRRKEWYAGQFVRKIVPKFKLTPNIVLFMTSILNGLKPILLSVLVRNVDKTFLESTVFLPQKDNQIDFDFMNKFLLELEAQRIDDLNNYLTIAGLDSYNLSEEEETILNKFATSEIEFMDVSFGDLFDCIKQGRRLKKNDQKAGLIPFVMSGITNTGVVNYISNPVAKFPANSITVDIFGNTFYRNYEFGAGDDTGVYWSKKKTYSSKIMLFFTASMAKALKGEYSYGYKLRSSKSSKLRIKLPSLNGVIDIQSIDLLISAVQKMVIKDIVVYAKDKRNSLRLQLNNLNEE